MLEPTCSVASPASANEAEDRLKDSGTDSKEILDRSGTIYPRTYSSGGLRGDLSPVVMTAPMAEQFDYTV
jgi:hypothetical protein